MEEASIKSMIFGIKYCKSQKKETKTIDNWAKDRQNKDDKANGRSIHTKYENLGLNTTNQRKRRWRQLINEERIDRTKKVRQIEEAFIEKYENLG